MSEVELVDQLIEGLSRFPAPEQRSWIEFFELMCAQMVRNDHKGWSKSYFNIPLEAQLQTLHMSVEEVRIALAYGMDVEDKLADVANHAAIMRDNYLRNPASHVGGVSE